MEISWKWLNLCLGLLFFQLCNGFPINLEDSVVDQHTQLLTGLVAVLLTVCSVVLLAGCLCCQRKNGFKEFRDSPVVASTASNLDHGHVNPIANGEFTIFTPLSSSPYNNNVFLANERIITRTAEDFVYEDFDVSTWFNEAEKDFPRIKLKYIKELGKGWFGKVVEGAAKEVPPNEEAWTPVVVRILEATASRKERVLFLNDAAIYRCGTHPNVLSLIGRCLDTVPLLLLQEYCTQGDLKNYLRSKRENVDQLLSSDYPLLWCCQLTAALKQLHSNGVVHPDLATRNCQLTADLTLKLGDYGLAESKYPEDYYQGTPRVPVRWCSPESLTCTLTTIQPKKTTAESNIWALAVTIWEICECGEQPFTSLSNDEVVSQVLGPPNIRLPRPRFPIIYTDYLYRLMQLCWSNFESRPTASQIDLMLLDLWQVYKNTKSSSLSADDFDKRWESFRPNSVAKNDNVTDTVEIEMSETNIAKPLSPSLNNLHGSLDNLLDSGDQMEFWLENVTRIDDFPFAKNNSNVVLSVDDPLVSEISSSESSDRTCPRQKKSKLKSKIDFDFHTKFRDSNFKQPYNFSDSALFSQRTSSESETEDENWRKKVERGAYTEKVRLKSRSVADLMILTHVDYSESESETPLPSLDYRVNYKNVRYAPKNNLENVSLTYGSEGNLLSVHDTFQEELKKLKEERRDSLLFVPDNHSQTSFNKLDSINTSNYNIAAEESNLNNMSVIDPTSKRLMHELNRVAEMQPANQVFNVFSVTIDKFKPIHVNSCKLNDIINLNDIDPCCMLEQNDKVQMLCEEPETALKPTVDKSPLHANDIHSHENKTNSCDINGKDISDEIFFTYPPVVDIDHDHIQSDQTNLYQFVNNVNVSQNDIHQTNTLQNNDMGCSEVETSSVDLKNNSILKENWENLYIDEAVNPTILKGANILAFEINCLEDDSKSVANSNDLDQNISDSTNNLHASSLSEPEINCLHDETIETSLYKNIDLQNRNDQMITEIGNQDANIDEKPNSKLTQNTGTRKYFEVPTLMEILNKKISLKQEQKKGVLSEIFSKKDATTDIINTTSEAVNEVLIYDISTDSFDQPELTDIIPDRTVAHQKEGNQILSGGPVNHQFINADNIKTINKNVDKVLSKDMCTEHFAVPKLTDIVKHKIANSIGYKSEEELNIAYFSEELISNIIKNIPESRTLNKNEVDDSIQVRNNVIVETNDLEKTYFTEAVIIADDSEVMTNNWSGNLEKEVDPLQDNCEKRCCNQIPKLSEIIKRKLIPNGDILDDQNFKFINIFDTLKINGFISDSKFQSSKIELPEDDKALKIDIVNHNTPNNVHLVKNDSKSKSLDKLQNKYVIANNIILFDSNQTLKVQNILLNNQDSPSTELNCENHVFFVPKLSEIIKNMDIAFGHENDENKIFEQCDYKKLDQTNRKKVEDSECGKTENIQSTNESLITFDLDENAEEGLISRDSTRMNVFTSTPSLERHKGCSTVNNACSNRSLFGMEVKNGSNDNINFYSDLTALDNSKELNYSLETWDNFLGRTLDAQNDVQNEHLFDSFSSEPHSLLFIESGNDLVQAHKNNEEENVNNAEQVVTPRENSINKTLNKNNRTFTIDVKNENTFVVEDNQLDNKNGTFTLNKTETSEIETEETVGNSAWGTGGGWFLHPQTSNTELSGTIEVKENTDSYVGFGIDDEIMAAIRTELLNKLPHAQVAPSEKGTEVEEWDASEKSEVFLKYNIYNPPLSPILEESYIEESDIITPKQESDNDDSEWSEPGLPETTPELESQSVHTYDSQLKGPHHRHTPSQDSCCSNDTLFNLEELTCVAGDVERESDVIKHILSDEFVTETELETIASSQGEQTEELEAKCNDVDVIESLNISTNGNSPKTFDIEKLNSSTGKNYSIEQDNIEASYNSYNIPDDRPIVFETKNMKGSTYISEFITQEIEHSSKQFYTLNEGSSSETNSSLEGCPIVFQNNQVAPLPSPEDNPWKQLPASLLNYEKVISQNNTLLIPATKSNDVVPENNDLIRDKDTVEPQCKYTDKVSAASDTKEEQSCDKTADSNEIHYENGNINNNQPIYENATDQPVYENTKIKELVYENVKVKDVPQPVYENVEDVLPHYENLNVSSDIYNEADYVNIVNLENSKNHPINKKDYAVDSNEKETSSNNDTSQDEDIYGMLTDIKFNGPTENQLISTSFSESNDINDEQDWDSGSDTRSSSSGEFIWKEGEHEESLKALRAAPQDVLEDIKPMEEIAEESTDESDVSSGSSDEEGEVPEFVPSAWDKFATPTKSALRSPEKTFEKSKKKKSKGVWFKKQKYHCVYEYPREPESPVLQSHDLWKPQLDYSSFTDWEFDADAYVPSTMDDSDIFPTSYNYQPKSVSSRNLYQLTSISDFPPSASGLEDEFFVSSSARPFDVTGSLSSQFFPGSANWVGENATPDSGMEDGTPGSSSESSGPSDAKRKDAESVQTLKNLAEEALKKYKKVNTFKNNDALGGLRHTRNKLKLDLPPSPSAFTSTKMFTVEPTLEPVIREKPTFTTFGKSRFSVQHVDTPPEESKNKNVSFEALPHKPSIETIEDCHIECCPDINEHYTFLQEKQILQDKFDGGKLEFIRGEASLLDSADEDSGIESSTLERKLSSDGLLQ